MQLRGIDRALSDSVDIDYIFMDTKNREESIAAEESVQLLRSRLSEKTNFTYDLVILGDDPAIDIGLEYRDEFFPDTPIVFLGCNSMNKAMELAKDPLITGVSEHMPVAETIELAKKLYPDAKKVIGISNNTNSGIGSLEQFYSCEEQFPELEFSDVDTLNYSVEELQQLVSTYESDTILLCLMFDCDRTGRRFQVEQGISWIYPYASIPIFKVDELGINSGALGGCVISYEDMAQKAGELVMQILNGENPANLSVVDMPSFYELNWDVMQKFNISKKQLPKTNVRYNNYIPSFWEMNSKWIFIVFAVLSIAFLIIMVLLLENQKRRRLNGQLTESDKSLNAAIEIANIVFYIYYPELHKSQGLSEFDPLLKEKVMLNYPECWIQSTPIHPEDVAEYRLLYQKIDEGADYAEAEIRILHNGAYRWYLYRLKSIYDFEGNRIKVIGARSDITLSKEIEANHQHHLNAFFSSNPNTLVSCRLNLTQNKVTQFYNLQEGHIRDNLQSVTDLDELNSFLTQTIHPESDRIRYLETFSVENLIKEYRRGNTSVSMNFRFMRNNELHWANARLEMVTEPKYGNVDAVYHAVDTSYNRILELLLESSASHDYDFISFVFGKTQRYASYSWLSPKELTMQENYCQTLIRDLDTYKLEDRDEIVEKLQWHTILENLNKYGEYTVFITQHLDIGVKKRKKLQFFYIDETEQLILGSQRDITDIYENEVQQKEALAAALQKANVANAAKTDFLSRMSHDMRTPMNAIIGITALALDETTNPVAVRDNLNKINQASHFLLSLINDILDMTKIEDGAVELHKEPYYYTDFIDNLRTMFQPLCNEKGIELIFESGDKILPPVIADKMRINQIFFNILSNAVKFTPEGGKIIYREENVHVENNRLHGDYSIIDTGIGMSKEFQKNMFKPFVQEDNGITSKIEGTGLGLSITKSLVELMGSTLTVESEKGKGTKVTVHFEIEIAKDSDDIASDTPNEAAEIKPILHGKRVLLVEDHPLNTEIATRLLTKKGMVVTSAENGEIALSRFQDSILYYFDVILMDIRMPVMDGLTTTRKIRSLEREDAKSIPIIAMTANAYQEDIQMSRAAGMDAHLAKPIEPKKLYDTLVEKFTK